MNESLIKTKNMAFNQFRNSLIRGTKLQASKDSDKKVFLVNFLNKANVLTIEELNDANLMELNIQIGGINQEETIDSPMNIAAWKAVCN